MQKQRSNHFRLDFLDFQMKKMMILFHIVLFFTLIHNSNCQASQWMDTFQKDLCHDRWSQMDWQSIIRPCRTRMKFGKRQHDDEKLRTSPKWSHTSALHFDKTAVFNKIAIQTRTGDGRNKNIGGDTWRIFIRGADRITPYVSDLDNGAYEAKFIALQPGFYKAEIVLESTLCEAYKDPPQDWLKRDATTIINDEKNAMLFWEPLRGGNISFKIEESPKSVVKGLRTNFKRWSETCGPQYTCDPLLWKGFGRWVNSSWIPYIDDVILGWTSDEDDEEGEERCLKENEGVLKLIGDEFTRDLSYQLKNNTLCNNVFQNCLPFNEEEQKPIRKSDDSSPKTFSTAKHLKNLKNIVKRTEMDEKSGLLLNYGHPFVRNIGFKQYRTFIDRAVKILKEKYKGKAVWRTMASSWRDSGNPEDHFMNHQRVKLFNAYATSAMCNAGIPVLDVFQMSESAPPDHKSAVLKNVEQIITQFYQRNPHKQCVKKTRIAKPRHKNQTATIFNQTNSVKSLLNNTTLSAVNSTAISAIEYGNSTRK